jgi:hypothetical protein
MDSKKLIVGTNGGAQELEREGGGPLAALARVGIDELKCRVHKRDRCQYPPVGAPHGM